MYSGQGFKLNRFNCGFLVIFIALAILQGCNRKDRLTVSTFNFGITPPAASVINNSTLSLSAHAIGGSGAVPVTPTWQVSPSSIGVVAPSIGSNVTFTAQSLGTAVVTATYDGVLATTQIDVVTYIPGSTTYSIYNDDGLPTIEGLSESDIFASGGITLNELQQAYTPEGTKYMEASSVDQNDFWGVTLDKNSVGASRDLSAYNAGSLKFSLRLINRTMVGGETLRVEISDLSTTAGVNLTFGSGGPYGFSGSSQNWQEISIPVSGFSGINLTQIDVPFSLVGTSLASTLVYQVDAVRWEP